MSELKFTAVPAIGQWLTFYLKPIMLTWWQSRKSHRITKVLRIDLLGTINVSTNFYGNPSTRHCHL